MAHGQVGATRRVVERKLIGGSSPNTNCLPSKNEIWSATVADLVHHADRFGIMTGPTAIDMARVVARKRDMVDVLIAMHLDNYKASGAELIMGTGRFNAPKTLEVSLKDGGTRVLTGDCSALNLGTHATIPDIPGLAAAEPLTNVEALELDRLPDHLVVIGGGYVGLELAQAYRRFGSRVTIIEAEPQLAGREDPDVAAAIPEMLHDEGIMVHLGAKILGVRGRSGQTVGFQLHTPSGDPTVEGSDILVATLPGSRLMPADMSRLTTGSRRAHLMSGRSASARAARSSPMCRSMISASFGTIWPAGTAPRVIGWSPTACSPTRRSRVSA